MPDCELDDGIGNAVDAGGVVRMDGGGGEVVTAEGGKVLGRKAEGGIKEGVGEGFTKECPEGFFEDSGSVGERDEEAVK